MGGGQAPQGVQVACHVGGEAGGCGHPRGLQEVTGEMVGGGAGGAERPCHHPHRTNPLKIGLH